MKRQVRRTSANKPPDGLLRFESRLVGVLGRLNAKTPQNRF